MSFAALQDLQVDAGALEAIGAEISAVERELGKQVHSEIGLVQSVGSHVLQAGGKRLRPAFLTLSARSTGLDFDPSRAYKLAACMEMIHMATLIHDDVIDNADRRRGRPTASSLFGNTAAILTGDVLLSKAMAMLAVDGDFQIIRTVASAVVEIAEGEVRELECRNRFDLPEEDHFEILRMKTASFIQCCCETGARLSGASDKVRDALGAYGHHIGLAFQIVDDVLDYMGDRHATGKPQATDFREGCATLPLIYLRPRLSAQEQAEVEGKFGNGATDEDIRLICCWIGSRGALDEAMQAAERHVRLAKDRLDALPGSSSRALLEAAADYVVLRKS